jgi:hypothetical protein
VSATRRAVDPRTGRLYRIVGTASSTARSSIASTPAHRSFGSPPLTIRKAQLDNLAIVPASLLPSKAQWQAVANQLPRGATLIVLPAPGNRQRPILQSVASGLRAKGQIVATVSTRRFASVPG